MKIYKQINERDLVNYLEISYDTNTLHSLEQPIIPGNLLLYLLEKMYQKTYQEQLTYLKVTFFSPAVLQEILCFDFNQKTFQINDTNQKMILKGVWNK